MPGQESGSGADNMYYAWQCEHTHFLAIDSESPIDTALINDAQMEWITSELETSVDRATTPWVIAHFHRPMYCSSDHGCEKGGIYLRNRLEETFYANKVDLVLQGHVHAYERTYPVYHNASTAHDYTSPIAPAYLLQGGSGNREGNKGSYPPPEELDEWSASQQTAVGYGLMTVTADSIDWKFYAASVVSPEDGAVTSGPVLLDSFLMTR